jgi:DNA-binding XRE family transcriptional regulator
LDKGNGRKPAQASGLPYQDPHGHGEVQGKLLEQAIGREVKGFREKLGLTIAELAKAADMSAGMLSKIENGATSPSLARCRRWGVPCRCPSPPCSRVSRKPVTPLS